MNSSTRQLIFFLLLLGLSAGAYQFMIRKANKQLSAKKIEVDSKLIRLAEFEQAFGSEEACREGLLQ